MLPKATTQDAAVATTRDAIYRDDVGCCRFGDGGGKKDLSQNGYGRWLVLYIYIYI